MNRDIHAQCTPDGDVVTIVVFFCIVVILVGFSVGIIFERNNHAVVGVDEVCSLLYGSDWRYSQSMSDNETFVCHSIDETGNIALKGRRGVL